MYVCTYVCVFVYIINSLWCMLFEYCHSRSEAIEQSENLLLISVLLYSTVYVSFDFSIPIGIVRYSLLHIKTEFLHYDYFTHTSTSGLL